MGWYEYFYRQPISTLTIGSFGSSATLVKGRTMLCGMIDEMEPFTKLNTAETNDISLSYFFCEAAIPSLSNVTSVLRGLLHIRMIQQPFIVRPFFGMGGLKIEDWDFGAMV